MPSLVPRHPGNLPLAGPGAWGGTGTMGTSPDEQSVTGGVACLTEAAFWLRTLHSLLFARGTFHVRMGAICMTCAHCTFRRQTSGNRQASTQQCIDMVI